MVRALPRCRDATGQPMPDDALCLTAGQADALGRWATETYLWSIAAYRACTAATGAEAVDAMTAGDWK